MDVFLNVIQQSLIRLDPAGDDLIGVVETLTNATVANGMLQPEARDEAIQAVLKREQSGSTVMPGGFAFPHGRTEVVPNLVSALGVFRAGRGIANPDGGEVTWLVALMFVPLHAAGNGHIHFLARLSQRLMKAEVVARLRVAEREDEVRAALCE